MPDSCDISPDCTFLCKYIINPVAAGLNQPGAVLYQADLAYDFPGYLSGLGGIADIFGVPFRQDPADRYNVPR